MSKHTYRTLLWGISLLGVLTFIFANSLVPAVESAEESGALWKLLLSLFPSLTHHTVRKLAHFAEYALLGAHLSLAPILLPASAKVSYPTALFFGAVVALVDEGIQRFVPGRGGALTDVLIDYLGYLSALLLMLAAFFIYVKLKRRKEHD